MSHTVEIKSHITNVNLLIKAFNELGWEIKEKCKMRTYSSDATRNEIYDYVAINPNGKFDLGINEIDGEFKIFGDLWDRSIAQQLGDELSILKTKYNLRLSKQLLEEQELEYEEVETDEYIELRVTD